MNDSTLRTACSKSSLDARQEGVVSIAALAAAGDTLRLNVALDRALNAGMPVSDAKEILVQLYAYAGFPRSLNALGELMKVVNARREQGLLLLQGAEPSMPAPVGDALLAVGKLNQTKLVGKEVAGPLFDFVPAANVFLRAHLFGDIFQRDNLDWQSREIATVAMLSTMQGVESQLRAHIAMSINVGISEGQLDRLVQVLGMEVDSASAERAAEALREHLKTSSDQG